MPRGGYPRLPARPGPHRSLRATFLIQLPSLPRRESSRESSSALRFLERLGLHPPTAPYRQSMGDPPKHRVCPFQILKDVQPYWTTLFGVPFPRPTPQERWAQTLWNLKYLRLNSSAARGNLRTQRQSWQTYSGRSALNSPEAKPLKFNLRVVS